jgi:hypothetical protein
MNWKYWVIKKMNPNSVKNAMVTEMLAAVNRRLANSRTSSMGYWVRRSHATKPPNRITLPRNPAKDAVAPQPRSGASMIVYTSRLMNAADSTSPATSRGCAFGSFDDGVPIATTAIETAATGPRMKKMLDQS